ncbi:MAG: 4-(cytidine 5'-diphospho)-2-C-methyl-D-erythritol kinase [Gammaproteobacteria bacterium]|nr:4-(cytidine 5'-diphospho)-2-C-methyl-D-erythritol kinase [Gammaproteobacteria bacterium]
MVKSPAKINTFLHVHQKRPDGFHELFTYFQLIDLCDKVSFVVNEAGHITVSNPAIGIPEEQDLCFRAAKLLQEEAHCDLGVDIVIDKFIPDGGGLGGGSSNAATVLVVLNKLWKLNLTEEVLLSLALGLGSDVPFFVYGKNTFARGRGEVFEKNISSDLFENKAIVVVRPEVRVSTAKIFHSKLLTRRKGVGIIRSIDTERQITCGENDFQNVVFSLYPSVCESHKELSKYSKAFLTGTGSCVYAVLDNVEKAYKIAQKLSVDFDVRVANALSKSYLNEFK